MAAAAGQGPLPLERGREEARGYRRNPGHGPGDPGAGRTDYVLSIRPASALWPNCWSACRSQDLVTHDIPFAQALCDRAVFFQAGVDCGGRAASTDLVTRFGWDLALERSKLRPTPGLS